MRAPSGCSRMQIEWTAPQRTRMPHSSKFQNELICEKSCKFISSLQCESSPSRIFPQAHPEKHFANLRYMARHFLPTTRITGVPWRSSDRFTNHLQYTSAETRSSHQAGRRRSKLCIAALPDPARRRRYCPVPNVGTPGKPDALWFDLLRSAGFTAVRRYLYSRKRSFRMSDDRHRGFSRFNPFSDVKHDIT